MANQGTLSNKIMRASKILKSFVQIFGSGSQFEKDIPTAKVTIRKGTLLESRELEYPKFRGSVLHNVRLPFKPQHLFKVECTDSPDRETIIVLAEKTSLNEDAIVGMPVTVTSRQNFKDFNSTEHKVTLD